MTATDTHDRTRLPAFVPRLNPLVGRLLRAGLPFGPNVLITIRGRSTGLDRTFPVALIALGERRFVQSPFGEVNWVRNLRVARAAVVTRGRDRRTVSAVELAPEVAGAILRDALAPYLRSRLLAPLVRRFIDVRRDSPLEAYVAEARTHPMFELIPRSA